MRYPQLTVVIDRTGSCYNVPDMRTALQLQAMNPGSYIMQKDDALSPAFVLVEKKD